MVENKQMAAWQSAGGVVTSGVLQKTFAGNCHTHRVLNDLRMSHDLEEWYCGGGIVGSGKEPPV